MKQQLMDEVKRTFKPEFLNRIDEVIVFHPLSHDNLVKIVELEIGMVKERLREQGISIEVDETAKQLLVEKGFDLVYGARPLKRVIQRYLEDPLAESVIARRVKSGSVLRAVRKGEGLEFEEATPAEHPASPASN
ncbi:MAG: ATP-dependent Clp protease ATP-binding subunit [Candidatus Omnitrophica bacterium]|nr:ATP-dependent Clp protease ATP-binding subunit [Candidatus Omnitrophota bacterium]